MKEIIKGRIIFESDFHIGSGLGKAGYVDSVFTKDANGHPVVTGPTLKGIIRDAAIRIANYFGVPNCQNEMENCDCVICQIFGRESLPGKIIISPATLDCEVKESGIRMQTKICDDTGTAAEHSLRSIEVAPAGAEFRFNIKIRSGKSVETLEKTLLLAALLWIREIGGNRRRGAGKCRLVIEGSIDENAFESELKKLSGGGN